MAKSKSHTNTASSTNGTEMASRNPSHKDTNLLKGLILKFLGNMCFAKEHKKKDLKKSQANNAKAVSARAETTKTLVKPQAIKPKMPKGPSHKISHLAFITHPKLGKNIQSYMTKDCRICQPEPKVQTKAEAKTPAKAQAPATVQAPKGAQAPVKAP
ncbi:60S ribosomal protein L29-like [Rattus rattus]|uniref:60S ribosomal protein L29-like n=1 Tax=Rattus rattus TaxID=10117 RepID=UPI0013F30EA8|nr:60S ribosomal protein L29-like [Rattus rattus]